MSRIAKSYPIPFIEKVTMPADWARWLSTNSFKNPALQADAQQVAPKQPVTWDYQKHGKAPWMQFFYDWRFADLDGDVQLDFILTGGAQRQVAYRQDGSILWAYHDESAGFMDIRLDSNFPVADVDGDGVPELVCARKLDGVLSLCMVNARDGRLKKAVPFPGMQFRPGDCRGSILLADVRGVGAPTDFIVSWDYRYLSVFTNQLEMLWERDLFHELGRNHNTMGHTPYPADVDGDGCEEILAGSCLLDQDGSTLWVAPDLPALMRDRHADSVSLVSLDEGEPARILMSTGAACFDLTGTLLWSHDQLLHGQALHTGKIRADVPGMQVVAYEAASRVVEGEPDKLIAYDKNGVTLWEFTVRQPDMQEGGFGFWLGDWNGDGLDEIFINDPEKVNILDGFGKVIDTLPGHLIYVFDLVGDRRVEAVILDDIYPGMSMQIWTNDAPNPNPQTNMVTSKPAALRAMYNCTRY